MDLIQKACNLGFILKNKEYYLWEIQRWLREVYKIDIVVHGFKKQPVGEEIRDEVYQVFVLDFAYHPYFKTYEDALEKGLQEALKLIKIN